MRKKAVTHKKKAKSGSSDSHVYKPPMLPEHPTEKLWFDWPAECVHDSDFLQKLHYEILSGTHTQTPKFNLFYTSLVTGSVPFMSPFIALAQARHHVFIRQKEISALRTARLAQAKESDSTSEKSAKFTKDEDQTKSTQLVDLPRSFHVALEYIFQMAREDIANFGPVLSGKYLRSLVSVLSAIPIGGMAQEDPKIIQTVSSYLTAFTTSKTQSTPDGGGSNGHSNGSNNEITDIKNISNSGYAIRGLVALVAASASLGLALDVIFTLLSSSSTHWSILPSNIQQLWQQVVGARVLYVREPFSLVKVAQLYKDFTRLHNNHTNGTDKHDTDPLTGIITGDGVYLYVLTPEGLFKLGTGLHGTSTTIYAHKPQYTYQDKKRAWLGVSGTVVFLQMAEMGPGVLLALNSSDLSEIAVWSHSTSDFEVGTNNTLLFSQPNHIGVVSQSTRNANCLSVFLYKPEQGLPLQKSYTIRWTSPGSSKIMSIGQRFNWMPPPKGDETLFDIGIPKSSASFNVVQITGCSSYVMMVTSSGQVYYVGKGKAIAEGNYPDSAEATVLRVFDSDVEIVDCATSGYHVLFLDSKGRVWAMGEGSNGELGDGQGATQGFPVLMNIPTTHRAVKIAAAANASFIVTDSGLLLFCGKQPQENSSTKVLTPKLYSGFSKGTRVAQIAIQDNYVIITTVGGHVYYRDHNKPETAAKSVDFAKDSIVMQIAAGGGSSNVGVLLEDGSVWSLDLASGEAKGVPNDVSPNVAKIASGPKYIILLANSGKVFKYKTDEADAAAKEIPNLEAVWIGGGGDHIFVITETENLPGNFWDSCKVFSDGTTIGFLVPDESKNGPSTTAVVRSYDLRSGQHLADSKISRPSRSSSFYIAPHSPLWYALDQFDIFVYRCHPSSAPMPKEPLSVLSYLIPEDRY